MKKEDGLGIRLEPDERKALERAATQDDRSMSALSRRIIVDWLRAHGHLRAAQLVDEA